LTTAVSAAGKGKVYTWGIGNSERLSHSNEGGCLVPEHVQDLPSRLVVCTVHSLVVAEEGSLHSFGGGIDGQLGHGSVGDEHSPKMVSLQCAVCASLSTAAASAHSLALTKDGIAWSSSLGEHRLSVRPGSGRRK
jgi:alpha-tubulin suppressor-like RCC1 family protein